MELNNISVLLREIVISHPNCFTLSCESRVENESRISWSAISAELMDLEDFFSCRGKREIIYIPSTERNTEIWNETDQ